MYQSAVKPYVTAEGQVNGVLSAMLLFCFALCLSVLPCAQRIKSQVVKQ
jgi:hypothetical protein